MTGKEFRIERVKMDFTQAELAEKLGISANTVSRYETEDLKIPKVVELSMKQLASKPKKITLENRTIEIVDIPTMYKMSDEEYRKFIRNDELMYVDHHDVLRSFIADYPLATTVEQFDILIEEMQKLRSKMLSRNE